MVQTWVCTWLKDDKKGNVICESSLTGMELGHAPSDLQRHYGNGVFGNV
jgi:hypothetical protein